MKELRAAGELVAVEAIDQTGLLVTSEGAFVRVLRVTPPNPLILSQADREAVANGFCHLVGRLRPGQSLQFYVDARPVRLDEVLGRRAPARSRRAPGRRRRSSARPRRAPRCRAGGCTRRWRTRCAGTPTIRPRSTSARTCSNYTDYSARRLGARVKHDRGTDLVHTLDTAPRRAIGRTLVFLFEHYQDADGGLTVPDVLRPYAGIEYIAPRK